VAMRTSRKGSSGMIVALACLSCIIIALSSSGCLDVYGAKSVFGAKPPAGKPVYKDRNKGIIFHDFETSIVDPTSWNFIESCRTSVKKDTEWLKVLIDISILDIPIPIPNVTIPERYVRVEVTMADGSKWVDSRYIKTTQEIITAINPIDGPWSVTVTATGLGFSSAGYQDSLKVMISTREPV
jgi:hypothetical protein